LDLQPALALGLLEGLAIVVVDGAADAQSGQVGHLMPVDGLIPAMEQVVAALHHRVADEEGLLALRAAQPHGAAVTLAALGTAQGAGPGIELPSHPYAFQPEGLLDDARGDAVVRQVLA